MQASILGYTQSIRRSLCEGKTPRSARTNSTRAVLRLCPVHVHAATFSHA